MWCLARGIRKEWREILKGGGGEEVAEHKFPGQRGCRIIFSERFETLHCLKLKLMWDRILCNDPENRRGSGRKDKQTGDEDQFQSIRERNMVALPHPPYPGLA